MTDNGRLREEAEQIVEALDILDLLNAYGHARIVGSVALDLIVKRDIDIHTLVLLNDLLEVAQHLLRVLLRTDGIREVRVTDFRERDSMKLTVDEYQGVSGKWTIDFWLTTNVSTTGFEVVEALEGNLDEEQREAILNIKRHYHIRGLLQNGISNLIYRAVAEDDVRDLNHFEQWLSKTRIKRMDMDSRVWSRDR
ncbi:MAG: hypothetical protein AM324_005365 [Candidatus Thorarchaeota archaeon SMTZ1-83]|nr:MAG: hypothetical protein AM324_06605 [Candidatus Thorarchaeota archaeon SMTZ1-83]